MLKSPQSKRLDRRKFLSLTAGASLAIATPAIAAPAKPPDRPNILWITSEDMSPTLGCYGDTFATTPNIDRLAAESVRYTNAYATAPVCSPVRSCLITGCLATTLGTPNLRSEMPIPPRMTGFPSLLRRQGYYCTNNVKTDYNTSNEKEIIRASWDACSATAHWRGRKPEQPFFAIFNDMVSHQSRTMVWPYEEFQEKVQTLLDPAKRHDPERVPLPPYYPDTPTARRTQARYYDCVSVMDQNSGRILEELERDGLAEDTIVFYYSDHGSGMPRHKRLLLDSGLHVPLLIRFPKKYQHLAPAAPGESLDRLVSFVDFPYSLLALLGIEAPDYMQGKPFLGPKAGAADAVRSHIHGARDRVDEAFDLARCVRDKNYLYIRNYMPHLSYNQPSFFSDQGEIRQEITALAKAGKLTTAAQKHYAGPTRALEELYDTKNDPHQIRNLAADPRQAERVKKMRELVRSWILETRDLGFLPECDMARRSASSTPYEMARQGDKTYPLEKIMSAAELVGAGPDARAKQIELLQAKDPAIRYWAVVGLRASGDKSDATIDALQRALTDKDAPAARIEAAWALVDAGSGGKKRALVLLEKDLQGEDKRVALRAARALQMVGEKARPALDAMKKTLADNQGVASDAAMFLRFVLEPAVAALE